MKFGIKYGDLWYTNENGYPFARSNQDEPILFDSYEDAALEVEELEERYPIGHKLTIWGREPKDRERI